MYASRPERPTLNTPYTKLTANRRVSLQTSPIVLRSETRLFAALPHISAIITLNYHSTRTACSLNATTTSNVLFSTVLRPFDRPFLPPLIVTIGNQLVFLTRSDPDTVGKTE